MTRELNYNVIFSSKTIIFQDIVMKRTINEGKLNNGLYYLDFLNKTLFANNIEDNKLWHWRIRHASDNILNKLMPLKILNNSDCDTYPFSNRLCCLSPI
jgi:hypothetical protein